MQKMAALGCLGLVLLIGVIVFFVGVGGYNRLNTLSNDVDGKWAQVQTQYQRRSDLIPNLVQTVQGSANFEKSTLTAVIDARAKATSVTIDPSHAPSCRSNASRLPPASTTAIFISVPSAVAFV